MLPHIDTCTHSHIQTDRHRYMQTRRSSEIHTDIHTDIQTYIQTYRHTGIRTRVCMHTCYIYIYIYIGADIYIYIERERERERVIEIQMRFVDAFRFSLEAKGSSLQRAMQKMLRGLEACRDLAGRQPRPSVGALFSLSDLNIKYPNSTRMFGQVRTWSDNMWLVAQAKQRRGVEVCWHGIFSELDRRVLPECSFSAQDVLMFLRSARFVHDSCPGTSLPSFFGPRLRFTGGCPLRAANRPGAVEAGPLWDLTRWLQPI